MGSQNQPLQNKGIFRNLPVFDPSIQGLTAVITGANGISGFHMLRALLEEPRRWKKIYALSRRPPPAPMMQFIPEEQKSRFEHIAVDFLESPEAIADILKAANVKADYIFFYSYLQPSPPPGEKAWSNADELIKVNGALLSNLLAALPMANIKPRRFLLQTGGKNYGAHIGRFRTPAFESDPQPEHLQGNFYYVQERMLFAYCEQQGVTWNVIRPGWIIGAVNNAAMNALYPFAVYATVQAHKKEPISFASDWDVWKFEPKHSTAMLIAYLSEWAVLEEKCQNEAFNSVDGGSLNWDRFFQELARWYGVSEGVVPPPDDVSGCTKIVMNGGKDTPMGYGPPIIYHSSFSMTEWARRPENGEAWKQIMEASKGRLTLNPFEDVDAFFVCGDAAFQKEGTLSLNKARRLGWTGFVDSTEAVFQMYQDMESLGMLPPVLVDSAHPQI